MPARMSLARQESNPTKKIWARDYLRSRHGKMLCLYCKCPVEGVQGTQPTQAGTKKHISPFYRLTKNWEPNGLGHHLTCRFNIENSLVKLVDESREVKRFDQEAIPILVRQGKRFEFRIHILIEAWRWTADQGGNIDSFGKNILDTSDRLPHT